MAFTGKISNADTLTPLGREVLLALFAPATFAEELKPEDPVRVLSDDLGALFTEAVEFLKSTFPNPELRKFGELLWDIVGNRLVPVAIGPNVPSVSFAGYLQGSVMRGLIILPPFWKKMVKEDPIMQLGAVIYSGSKAIDFYNNILDAGTLDPRAQMFEAEYLRTVKREEPSFQFNAYQKQVLANFPKGLDDEKAAPYRYESKPFFVAQA